MDMGLIAGAATALRGAADIAKGLIALDKMADVQAKAIELQSIILNVQSSLFAAQTQQADLLEQVGELKAKVEQAEAWKAVERQYQLKVLEDGKADLRFR
jgi:hypothetical protein